MQKITVSYRKTYGDGWPDGPPESQAGWSASRTRVFRFDLTTEYDHATEGDVRPILWAQYVALATAVEAMGEASDPDATGITVPRRDDIAEHIATACKAALGESGSVTCRVCVDGGYGLEATV